MAIPNIDSILYLLLKFLGDGKPHSMKEAEKYLATHFNLNQDELNQLKPSGGESLFHNRIHWAKFYLKKADLLENPPRSPFKITPRGASVLKEKMDRMDIQYLKKFSEFSSFIDRKR